MGMKKETYLIYGYTVESDFIWHDEDYRPFIEGDGVDYMLVENNSHEFYYFGLVLAHTSDVYEEEESISFDDYDFEGEAVKIANLGVGLDLQAIDGRPKLHFFDRWR